MRILLTGQCTLHWGRMEFGNLGNYAIVEPLFRGIHKAFPDAFINTTFQMSDEFCSRERINKVPMEIYYSWKRSDLLKAIYETIVSAVFGNKIPKYLLTDYISEVLYSDLVIDFSGDIWGDNADLVGQNRFLTGALKDLTAHNLGKKIAMIAGSPGPFLGLIKKTIAKYVFGKFDLVTNREEISTSLLWEGKFQLAKVHSLACPAFLFDAAPASEMKGTFKNEGLTGRRLPKVGFIVCGWNMQKGPFGLWPREDSEYEIFAETVEWITNNFNAEVYLLSHNNGFIPPPNFKMTEGRDHQILKQLFDVLNKRGIAKNVKVLSGIYTMPQTKAIIGKFDMLVSGRIHAAVSGFTQFIPTVIIDYGHEPKAHKLKGFAKLVQMTDYIADPADIDDMLGKVTRCWKKKEEIKEHLRNIIPEVRKKAEANFELLKQFQMNGN
jgi:colanic acid/amylovoran biosynthesis protein